LCDEECRNLFATVGKDQVRQQQLHTTVNPNVLPALAYRAIHMLYSEGQPADMHT
jgi:hypothetical protein